MAEDQFEFDTSITRTFRGAPGKLAVALVGSLVFLGLCLGVATGRLPGIQAEEGDVILGWIGAAFFGFVSFQVFKHFVKGRAVTIEISPDGLRDHRLDTPLIPWSGITEIKGWEHRSGSYVRLGLDADSQWEVLARVPDSEIGLANKLLAKPGLAISVSGTDTDTVTLLAVCDAYWKAHRGS